MLLEFLGELVQQLDKLLIRQPPLHIDRLVLVPTRTRSREISAQRRRETADVLLLTTAVLLGATSACTQANKGDVLFEKHCASCHGVSTAAENAPELASLRQHTPEAILTAVTTGSMSMHVVRLTQAQKRAIAEYAASRPLGSAPTGHAAAMTNRCPEKPFSDPMKGPNWNGWGVGPDNSRFQSAAGAKLSTDQVPNLKLKWAFGFPGGTTAYGQPTIVGGRVFVGSDIGFVYSIDAASGCVFWSFEAQASVRTAISIGPIKRAGRDRFAAYFGDIRANVYAVDAETGSPLWTKNADDHPLARITGAPALNEGWLFVPVSSLEEASGGNPAYECCRFRGSVVAFDANSGQQIWKSYTIPETPRQLKRNSSGTQLWGPAGAAIWSSPTIDVKRRAIYVSTGNAYTEPAAETSDAVVAFDFTTGKILWSRQLFPRDAFLLGCGPTTRSVNCPNELGPDFDFGNSPMLRDLPGNLSILVIGQKSGVAYALDLDHQHRVLWENRIGRGGPLGGMQFGSSADEQTAYFPNADAQYGPAEAGGLTAIRLATGERIWHTRPPAPTCDSNESGCSPAQSAATTVIPGVVFSGAMDGTMRAYSTRDGRIIWETNTWRTYATVNGIPASGGSINGPGPTVAGGMLFFNSGYSVFGGGKSGNVLLAFGVE
jgi:polyvinyl alcohol dehydrogenase (cytochrome)